MTKLYRRHAEARVVDAISYSPAVFLMGARQVGKSTLAQQIVTERGFTHSVTLDNESQRDAAARDPTGFVASLEGPTLVDEVQRVPDLLLAIKQDIDRERRPGRFLLTGSANVLTVPSVNEALTGRAALVTLWPLAQSELQGTKANVIDALFAAEPPRIADAPVGRKAFVSRLAQGGYPVARTLSTRHRRQFLTDYLTSTLERDLRDIADARKSAEMPRLLRLLASRTGNIHVTSNVALALGLTRETTQAYVRLLETVFLVRSIPAWRPGIGGREIPAPQVHLVDSGLLAAMLGADEGRIADDDRLTGRLLESFVAMEIARHLDWAGTPATQYHYRDGRQEIDIVLEAHSGELAAIEVKASATVRHRDWRALARLRDARGEEFRCGVVIYTGAETLPLSDRIWAVPVSGLWAA